MKHFFANLLTRTFPVPAPKTKRATFFAPVFIRRSHVTHGHTQSRASRPREVPEFTLRSLPSTPRNCPSRFVTGRREPRRSRVFENWRERPLLLCLIRRAIGNRKAPYPGLLRLAPRASKEAVSRLQAVHEPGREHPAPAFALAGVARESTSRCESRNDSTRTQRHRIDANHPVLTMATDGTQPEPGHETSARYVNTKRRRIRVFAVSSLPNSWFL